MRKQTIIKNILNEYTFKNNITPNKATIDCYAKLIYEAVKPQKKQPILYWNKLVDVWFEFNKNNYNGFEPSFDDIEREHLQRIIKNLKRRTEAKGAIWDEQTAIGTLNIFLNYAHKDDWLYKNFLLKNISSHLDKILKNHARGKGNTNVNMQSAFDKISRLS